MSYIPKGCDQQGRHPDKAEPNLDPNMIDWPEDIEPDDFGVFRGLIFAITVTAACLIIATLLSQVV